MQVDPDRINGASHPVHPVWLVVVHKFRLQYFEQNVATALVFEARRIRSTIADFHIIKYYFIISLMKKQAANLN